MRRSSDGFRSLAVPALALTIVFAAAAGTGATTAPTPADVASAAASIEASQQPDGSYAGGNALAGSLQTTLRAAEVLGLFPTSAVSVAAATSFLDGATLSSTESRARRLLLRASAADAMAVAAAQSAADQGFGAGSGFDSNVLDTALAIEALRLGGSPSGLVADDLTIAAGQSDTVTIEVPADATALEILLTDVSGTVEVRIKEGQEPDQFDPFFTISAGPTIISIVPGGNPPLTPGTNFIQFSAPAGATVSYEICYFAPSGDTTALTGALAYLLAARNADGGWGFSENDENSQLYFTHWVYRAIRDLAPGVDVSAFVLGKQVGGGGFGDAGTASAFDTAVGLVTLALAGVDPTVSTPGAIAFLEGQQDFDGSFGDDPYVSAWAIDALLAARAPLSPLLLSNGGGGPGANFVTDQSTAVLTGVAPIGARGITVDDPTAIVTFDAATGEYTITVNLTEGTNVLTIAAVNLAGVAGPGVTITIDRDSSLLGQDVALASGFNLVGVTLDPANTIGAFALLDFLGPDVTALKKIDPTTGQFLVASRNGDTIEGDDFSIDGLTGLIVVTDGPAGRRLVGSPIPNPTADLFRGVNLLTVPTPPDGLDAFGLLALIGNDSVVSAVQRFDSATQRFETAGYDAAGTPTGVNFTVPAGEPLIVLMRQDVANFVLPVGVDVEVTITSPANGATITQSPVTVSGTVTGEEPIVVTVNGVSANVTGGTWTASVPLTTPGSNVLTAVATDAMNRTDSASITVTFDPVDFVVPIGGLVTGSRTFSTTADVVAQIAFFTETQIGVPPGIVYTTTGVSLISATELQVDFQIDATGAATPGIQQFQVEYGLLDANSMPLGPLFDNLFTFRIEVTSTRTSSSQAPQRPVVDAVPLRRLRRGVK